MSSVVRQNYHAECEAAINKQINLELYASYVYLSMAHYFNRDDVALSGFHKFYKENSDEERGHADMLMKYQNMRGGRIVLQDIKAPAQSEWASGVASLEMALALEKKVNESLLELHAIASKHSDANLTDYLEGEFLKPQVESMKEIVDLTTRAKLAGVGLGEYMFNKELLEKSS
ncbi:soma ferritin-like [Tubulanus polymorphus]|uniref:soma ferritin-like n=1 Tax=Tubulanus polymorphus TaxID=672921 RepID=UPI003DA20193